MRMRKLRGPHMKKSMPFEPFRTHTQPVNLADLNRFEDGAEVTPDDAAREGLATRKHMPVKILGQGRAERKNLTVPAHGFSATAREAIEAAGGTCQRRSRSSGMIAHDRQRLQRPGDPQEDRLHGRDPGALPARLAHPGARASTSTRSTNIQKNFTGTNILGFLNLFSGGGLQHFAIFSLGIMPYITASIILQLLTVAVPSLEKLQKEGEVGQQKITQYTRYLTVALAAAQSIGFVFLFRTIGASGGSPVIKNFNGSEAVPDRRHAHGGHASLLMWMGELITQRGIGNGISLLIFASIVSGLPHGVRPGGPTRTRSSW